MAKSKAKSSQSPNKLHESKLCASCGRRFDYQKRWENTWESVRYCSKSCRQDKLEKRDIILEESIVQLLTNGDKKTAIDPSTIDTLIDTESYKNIRERTRRAARRLVAKGKIDILQKGRIVDASSAKGVFQVRLK